MSQLTPTLPVRHRHAAEGAFSLSHYDADHARALVSQLTHLDQVAGQDSDTAWLDQVGAGFDLVTASVDGMLVGYLAAEHGETVRLTRTALAPQAVATHPQLPVVLAEAVLTHVDRPWADLVVPEGFAGLAALLDAGWSVDESDAPDASTVRLSGR